MARKKKKLEVVLYFDDQLYVPGDPYPEWAVEKARKFMRELAKCVDLTKLQEYQQKKPEE